MTVKELIKELEKYDGRAATVLVHNVYERYYSEIDLVVFDSEDNTCEIVVRSREIKSEIDREAVMGRR